MSAIMRRDDVCHRVPSAPAGVLVRAIAATVASLATLTGLAGCATDRLDSAAPKGVDLTGEWQLNPNLSDDPQKPVPDDNAGPSNMRHRGGRSRGGGGGMPPFGNPGGAGGRGRNVPSDGNDLTYNSDVGTRAPTYVRTLWQVPDGTAGAGAGAGSRGSRGDGGSRGRPGGNRFSHWLDAPDRMTIQQSGGKLTTQSKSPNGDLKTDEFVSGHASDISVGGQNTADRDVGWRGKVFVVDTKVKSGPTVEQEYAIDDDGRLIVSTLMNGSGTRKVDVKRVYDRVSTAQGVRQ